MMVTYTHLLMPEHHTHTHTHTFFADVAQLVEHFLGKEGVTSSNLVIGSKMAERSATDVNLKMNINCN